MIVLKGKFTICLIVVLFTCLPSSGLAQEKATSKDSVIFRRIYRDTIIYRYDTIRIKYYVHTDTVWTSADQVSADSKKKRTRYNPNNWGIGPSVGAYYSPYNGFDINIGFGIQYYLFAVPNFRNPHLRNKKEHHK
ncbi:MAG: hypothetical protein ABI663_10570 [Chryseolinea sp.]